MPPVVSKPLLGIAIEWNTMRVVVVVVQIPTVPFVASVDPTITLALDQSTIVMLLVPVLLLLLLPNLPILLRPNLPLVKSLSRR